MFWQVCAESTEPAIALANKYPALRFVVQMCESAQENMTVDNQISGEMSGSITVQKRAHAAVQNVKDAAVYLLRLATHSTPAQIKAELQAHVGVLSANSSATLILAPRLLPEPGTVDPDVEAMARLRDLSHLQLTNECDLELDEAEEIVNSVHDGRGRLVVVNKLWSRNSPTVAVGVKYEAYYDGLCTVGSAVVQ
jgi:hypothetical protein